MVEVLKCNICEVDIYVNDSVFVGKDKVPPEVEAHVTKQSHQDKMFKRMTEMAMLDTPEGESVASKWSKEVSHD